MPVLQMTQALFVAWQHPETRRTYPVGRLMMGCTTNGSDGLRYEFVYIKGALEAQKAGFKPFLAFPDLNKSYCSEDMFPFFANRLISRSRPDFEESVDRLGLDPESADEMAILSRSGGIRATDSIELFPMPTFDVETACYQSYFLAHGLRYLPPSSIDRVNSLNAGDALFIMADVQNPYDRRAIALRTDDRINVGYLPRYLLEDAWQLLEKCDLDFVKVTVQKVNPAPAPIQQRLLCHLRSCWPDGFKPFSTDTYQPLAASSARK